MFKKLQITVLLLALSVIGWGASSSMVGAAAPADFLGNWVNTDTATRGIVRLVFTQSGANYIAQGFGACSPTPCDFGVTTFNLLGYNVSDTNPNWGVAVWDSGFKTEYLVAHREGELLVVESYNVFKDGSGRSNYRSLFLFKKS